MEEMLSNQEKLDALKFMSQIHRQQFDERRKYEWKSFYTTLTFFVLIGAAKFNKDVLFPINAKIESFLIVAVIILSFISISFLVAIYRANSKNKSIAHNSEDLIRALIINQEAITVWDVFTEKETSKIDKPSSLKTNNGIWSLFYQIATLLSVGIATILVLSL